ncbi:MAG: ParB/RepB/Spo0J family partition protein [Terriglobales bacterium]
MTQDKRKALGRGLDSLLPKAAAAATVVTSLAASVTPPAEPGAEAVRELALDEIHPNPYQTRRQMDPEALAELAASIAVSGVLQPIVVRYIAAEKKYQLIAGERRYQASVRAGKTTIPAIVRQMSDQQALEATIIENLQREDLNPMEEAAAFERLGREFGLTQEQIAQRTGKPRSAVANYLRLLRMPDLVQECLLHEALSFGHAKVLMMLDAPQHMTALAERIARQGLSVRQTEDLVRELLHPERKATERPARIVDPNVREAERRLESALGVRVFIKDKNGRGKIVIEYHSLEDFDRVLEVMGAEKK